MSGGQGRRFPRWFTAPIALMLALHAVPAGASSDAPARCRADRENVYLYTFDISMTSEKKSYQRGSPAHLRVTVTRPGSQDPLGQGQQIPRVVSVPAADVYVAISVRVRDYYLIGTGLTDAQGHSVVEIDLPKDMKPGKAYAEAFAWKQVASLPCVMVSEIGYITQPDAFVVR